MGRPDLPSWLHLIQHDYTQPGYLYGTPSSPDDSVNLQVGMRRWGTTGDGADEARVKDCQYKGGGGVDIGTGALNTKSFSNKIINQ